MKAEDQYMDDIFRKAAAEQHFAYQPDFWKEVESQLNDDSLDTAFKLAAGRAVVMPDFNLSEALEDAFLDDAFRSASEKTTTDYPAGAWSAFLKDEAVLEQDAAFIAAANAVTTDYHPAFWTDADKALQNEGLHYEYKSAYWNEAKNLLDHADRRVFFTRWSAVAAILLLLSFGGLYQSLNNGRIFAPMTGSHINPNTTATSLYTDQSSLHQTDAVTIPESELRHNAAVTGLNQSADPHGYTQNDLSTTSQNAANTEDEGTITQTGDITLNEVINSQSSDERILQSGAATEIALTDLQIEETDLSTDLTPLPGTPVDTFNPDNMPAYTGPLVEIERFKMNPVHTLSLVGGAGIGNKYGEPDFMPSYRTSVGFEYNRTGFGRLRHFEFGGNFTMNHVRQNGLGTERRVSVFNLDGGTDKFWYKLQLKDMIYANAGVYASYQLNRRHSLRATMGVDYLVFVQSNMSYKVNADEDITTVNNNWGVKDGLNKLDLRLGLGYEFDITRRFAVQLNGSFGFFDRTDDEFISKNFFDHEMSATVGLKYTFLRKL